MSASSRAHYDANDCSLFGSSYDMSASSRHYPICIPAIRAVISLNISLKVSSTFWSNMNEASLTIDSLSYIPLRFIFLPFIPSKNYGAYSVCSSLGFSVCFCCLGFEGDPCSFDSSLELDSSLSLDEDSPLLLSSSSKNCLLWSLFQFFLSLVFKPTSPSTYSLFLPRPKTYFKSSSKEF